MKTTIKIVSSYSHSYSLYRRYVFKLKKRWGIFWITIGTFKKYEDAEHVKELLNKPF